MAKKAEKKLKKKVVTAKKTPVPPKTAGKAAKKPTRPAPKKKVPAKKVAVAPPAKAKPKLKSSADLKKTEAVKPATKAATPRSKAERGSKAEMKPAEILRPPIDEAPAARPTPARPKKTPATPPAPPAERETDEVDEVILTDADGRRYCRVKDCDQVSTVDGYCRYHYLLFWKKIQVRKKILSEGKLSRYIEELTSRYPDKFLEMLRKDLRSEKEFLAAIQELEIDESSGEGEFEEETQTYLDEVRGMAETAPARDDEDF